MFSKHQEKRRIRSENEEDSMDDDNAGKKKSKIVRTRWSKEQKAVTKAYFKVNIKNKKPPTEAEIEMFCQKTRIMENKDWKKIKAFIFNDYSKK